MTDHRLFAKRIEEDHKDFRDVYAGRIRKNLRKFINNGTIFRTRPNGKRLPLTVPKLDIPHIVHGENDKGTGRGDGKPGDVIKKGGKGKGKGKGGGDQSEQEGIEINLDLDEVLKFMEAELALPPLKPKPNDVLEEEEIKYTSISLTGPESLRHNRRTMLQALKRQAASGEINKLHVIPGFNKPVKIISPINADKRYRQYRIVKKPSSNAVIFFARDGSGSMDQQKCDIVSDICWWLDIWIRRYYARVERCYIWHDTQAMEVDESKFYRYRFGGGTTCSSALRLIAKQFESRFPASKWNFYVFYFTDGENWDGDNQEFIKILKKDFTPEVVNSFCLAQILAYPNPSNIKTIVDKEMAGASNVRTTEVVAPPGTWVLSDEERSKQTKQAIMDLLGANRPEGVSVTAGSDSDDD